MGRVARFSHNETPLRRESHRAMIDPATPHWERSVLEKIALKAIEEQRRARQWGILFKLLWLTFAFLVLASFLGWIGRGEQDGSAASVSTSRHTAVIDVEGVI